MQKKNVKLLTERKKTKKTQKTVVCYNAHGSATSSKCIHISAAIETYSFDKDAHEIGELVCEHSQHGSEGAQACCKQDEEWQLLLRVH